MMAKYAHEKGKLNPMKSLHLLICILMIFQTVFGSGNLLKG
jgi:hypothetical protein